MHRADVRSGLLLLLIAQALRLVEGNEALDRVRKLRGHLGGTLHVDVLARTSLVVRGKVLFLVPPHVARVHGCPVGGVCPRGDNLRTLAVRLQATVLDVAGKDFVVRLVVKLGGVVHHAALLEPEDELGEQVERAVEVLTLRRDAAFSERHGVDFRPPLVLRKAASARFLRGRGRNRFVTLGGQCRGQQVFGIVAHQSISIVLPGLKTPTSKGMRADPSKPKICSSG